MARFDSSTAEIVVFTYREGLLSKVAHDLELEFRKFEIDLDEARRTVRATIDATSLKAVSAMENGRKKPGALSEKDRREIEENASRDVLEVRKYPTIEFVAAAVSADGNRHRITGTLKLHGRERSVTFLARSSEGGRRVAEVEVFQPDFGIKPFVALLGAMKIRPEVRVRVTLPG